MRACVGVALILAATVAPIMPAAAQPGAYPTPYNHEPGDYADPFYGRQGDQICRRWCLKDRNPCDPVHYKVADGRCSRKG